MDERMATEKRRMEYKDKHKGERCFVIGNGPSLNDIDLGLLEDEVTFGSNRIYLSEFIPTYYCAVNPLVIRQYRDEIRHFGNNQKPEAKFLPMSFAQEDEIGINTDVREPMFQDNLEEALWEGHTVTYVLIQLAVWMGFKEIILIGVDHYYGERGVGQPNSMAEAVGPDESHFHPDYFTDGVAWHLPDLKRSELAYCLAKNYCEENGIRIVNASAQTALRVFELLPFNYVIAGEQGSPKVSAIVSAYYSEPYLWGCLEDLERQTMSTDGALEIVIVCEAGSVDEEIAVEFAGSLKHGFSTPKVKIITTEGVPSVFAAWQMGSKMASGKYLTTACTDDRHHPAAYEVMAAYLDAMPHVDLVYHDAYITWKANQTIEEFMEENAGKELVAGRVEDKPGIFLWPDYSRTAIKRGCFIGPQPMNRASLHQKYGHYNENFKSAGDYDLWLRSAREDNFYHINMVLGLYLARLDGVELSNPQRSQYESGMALMQHASEFMEVSVFDAGIIKVQVGGEHTLVTEEDFAKLYKEVVEAQMPERIKEAVEEESEGARGLGSKGARELGSREAGEQGSRG